MEKEKNVTDLTPEQIANMVKSVGVDERLDEDEKILGGTGVSIDDHVSDEELYDKFVYDPDKGKEGEKKEATETKRTVVHAPPRHTKTPRYKTKASNRKRNKAAKKSRKKNRKKK